MRNLFNFYYFSNAISSQNVSVHMLEPGLHGTQLLNEEVIKKGMYKDFHSAPREVQEYYGEKCLETCKYKTFLLLIFLQVRYVFGSYLPCTQNHNNGCSKFQLICQSFHEYNWNPKRKLKPDPSILSLVNKDLHHKSIEKVIRKVKNLVQYIRWYLSYLLKEMSTYT